MIRIVVPSSAVQGRRIVVDDAGTVHHVVRVQRARPGVPAECVDGAGRRFRGTITECGQGTLVVDVAEVVVEPPPRVPVTLIQSLIRPERFEWVVEKATELGIHELIPLIASRSASRAGAGEGLRLARWRRIAASATAQCGLAWLPVIRAPLPLGQALAAVQGACLLMPTLEAGTAPFADQLARLSASPQVALLIGPEGDFAPDEIQEAVGAGARLVRLGRLTLRSETAAVASLAIVQQALGAW